jgi:hypothetical protein
MSKTLRNVAKCSSPSSRCSLITLLSRLIGI